MNDVGTPPPGSDETVASPSSSAPEGPRRIGPYVIKREIARGGMGVVFEATQDEPRRTVAIKVMQHTFAGEEMLRRFRYEAQLLARLRHPGIAQVYEAGTYVAGGAQVPFFAMEYIPNAKPITEYAQAKHLGVRERLELFARVCDAVHHGHQRGIVHRDLKPGNILVDSAGQPRVIDFGVARAVDSDMATMQTRVGQIVGSIQYMSPEQFDADSQDIDTRSDIYALGVVLYELLSGRPPYDLSTSTIVEAARVVQEQRPARLAAGGAARAGEVETIVFKAMEKDREHRYQSAHGLATDIRRYLNGEAIAAKPPSLAYQLKVFSRRNKAVIAAAAAIVVVLAGASVVSTVAWVRSERDRVQAREQTERALAAVMFLKDMVGSAVPKSFGAEVSLHTILDQAVKGVPTAFPDDPLTQADIYATLAQAYQALWDFDKADLYGRMALDMRERQLGPSHELTLESLGFMGLLYTVTGQTQNYQTVCSTRVQGESERYGLDHPHTLDSKLDLAVAMAQNEDFSGAKQLVENVLEVLKKDHGDDEPKVILADADMALIMLWQGQYEEAEALGRKLMERCRRAGDDSEDLLRRVRSQQGAALIAQGKIDEAAALLGNKPAPGDFGILSTFQGDSAPGISGTNLYVFWESWCPFSQRAVPWLETVYRRYKDQNLHVFGFTTVNRTSTDEKVRRFLRTNDITYPVYKESGIARSYLNMTATPFITIFKDGRLIWEDELPTEHFPEHMLTRVLL